MTRDSEQCFRRYFVLNSPYQDFYIQKFWLNLDFLTETKILKKFIRKGKQTQKFISNISRIILSKKLFVSLKKMRIVYIVGSDDITYRMLSGLSSFLISVFNKNKLKKKTFITDN